MSKQKSIGNIGLLKSRVVVPRIIEFMLRPERFRNDKAHYQFCLRTVARWLDRKISNSCCEWFVLMSNTLPRQSRSDILNCMIAIGELYRH